MESVSRVRAMKLENIVTTNVRGEAAQGLTSHLSTARAVDQLSAPVAHRFAAGCPGVAASDVLRAKSKKSSLNVAFMGCTPLDLATACDNPETIEALIKMGADPNNKGGIKAARSKEKPFEGKLLKSR